MNNSNQDLSKHVIKVAITLVAVILLMYIAKSWFVDRPKQSLPINTGSVATQDAVKVPTPTETNTSKVISWEEAGDHYGEYLTVEGKIVATHNSGKACFLNFHPNYRVYFTAVIFAKRYYLFPNNPERYYYGKKVQVSGRIQEYQGKPEIILNDPSQIKVIE